MGQYLSQPSTDKESEEGHADHLAYGLAAMQGWRVSMEDAHIAVLDLEPASKTSLFSVFDGHGGRAVSQFCAAHLAEEFVGCEAYRQGDLAAAITHAYFALDARLDSEEGRAELRRLVASAKPREPASLFTDVESQVMGAAPAPAHTSQSEEDASTPLAGSAHEPSSAAGAAASSSAGSGGGGDAREALQAEAERAMKKLPTSKDFLESHLMRASVLAPVGDEREQDEQSAGGAADAAGAANGAAAAAAQAGEEEEEEEPEHHAAGMGATAVTVIVRGNRVVVANTGDSRCVLSKRGQARALTLDHKPILFEEAKRIIKAGGFVRDNRINGALNVSRTIGDLDFKRNAELSPREQMVVATPDIESFTLEEGDEFLILACDGIWDVLTNQEAVDFVRKRLKAGEGLRAICEAMCDACLAPDLKGLCRGADNMSVVIVLFKKHAKLGGFWATLLAACGRVPAYKRMPSSSEARSRH